MWYASILPPELVDEYDGASISPVRMTLAHQLTRNWPLLGHYIELTYRGATVIVDNGVIETGHAMEIGELVKLAQLEVCNEIVLPDVYNEALGTIIATKRAIKQLPRERDFRTIGVVHAKNRWQLYEVYSFMLHSKGVDIIAFPKVLTQNFRTGERPHGRLNAMCLIFDRWGYPDKPVHLLGIWDDPREIALIERAFPRRVRSVDSNYAAAAALKSRLLSCCQFPYKPEITPGEFEAVRAGEVMSGTFGAYYGANLGYMDALAAGGYV